MAEGPIYWHQGLFLQPQHFQILNRQIADMAAPVISNMRPFFWGLASGGLDQAAVSAGRLEISGIEMVFQSTPGMIVLPGNAVCGGRRISAESIPADGSLTAYIGLKPFRTGRANVTVAENNDQMEAAPTRLAVLVEPDDVADIYGDGPPAKVQRMFHVLNLVFENELDQAGDMDLIPLGRLTREGDRISLYPGYVPPCLSVSASPELSSTIREIRDRVLGKVRQLEGYKNLSASGQESATFTLLLMGLRTLSRFAARLDHAMEAPCLTPWEAYGILRELVAELSVFSVNISVFGEDRHDEKLVPDYSHTDLGDCFGSIRDVISGLLEGITAGPRFVTRFEFRDPYWSAEIPQQILAEARTAGGEFWLVLHSETMDAQAMSDSASRLLKFSATGGMQSLLVRALPGIPLAISDGPPPGMPRRHGALYFRVGRESPLWAEVEKSGGVSIFWSEAPEDLDAQLAVLTR